NARRASAEFFWTTSAGGLKRIVNLRCGYWTWLTRYFASRSGVSASPSPYERWVVMYGRGASHRNTGWYTACSTSGSTSCKLAITTERSSGADDRSGWPRLLDQ